MHAEAPSHGVGLYIDHPNLQKAHEQQKLPVTSRIRLHSFINPCCRRALCGLMVMEQSKQTRKLTIPGADLVLFKFSLPDSHLHKQRMAGFY